MFGVLERFSSKPLATQCVKFDNWWMLSFKYEYKLNDKSCYNMVSIVIIIKHITKYAAYLK